MSFTNVVHARAAEPAATQTARILGPRPIQQTHLNHENHFGSPDIKPNHGQVPLGFPYLDRTLPLLQDNMPHAKHNRENSYNEIQRHGYAYVQPDGSLGLTWNPHARASVPESWIFSTRPLAQTEIFRNHEMAVCTDGTHDVEFLQVDMEAMQVSEDYDSVDYDSDCSNAGYVNAVADGRWQPIEAMDDNSDDFHADRSGSPDEDGGSDRDRRVHSAFATLNISSRDPTLDCGTGSQGGNIKCGAAAQMQSMANCSSITLFGAPLNDRGRWRSQIDFHVGLLPDHGMCEDTESCVSGLCGQTAVINENAKPGLWKGCETG